MCVSMGGSPPRFGRPDMSACMTHSVCVSSDSGLPECKCWCAECKAHMKSVRDSWVPTIRIVRGA